MLKELSSFILHAPIDIIESFFQQKQESVGDSGLYLVLFKTIGTTRSKRFLDLSDRQLHLDNGLLTGHFFKKICCEWKFCGETGNISFLLDN